MYVKIIGAGLIGGSIAKALHRANHHVTVTDESSAHIKYFQDEHPHLLSEYERYDVVIVATFLENIPELLIKEAKPNTLVMDVGSVKQKIVDEYIEQGGDSRLYIGTHPIAGSENSGPMFSRPNLFRDKIWVIAEPTETSEIQQRASTIIADCHAQEVRMRCSQHDDEIALSSHIPQILSTLIAARIYDEPISSELVGQGFRDIVRIANSNPMLWASILTYNTESIVNKLRYIADDLSELIANLERVIEKDGDRQSQQYILELFEKGNKGVDALPGRHGELSEEPLENIGVYISDKPGQLSKLMNDISQSNINVEDIRLNHSFHVRSAMAEITVARRSSEKFIRCLIESGWTIDS